MKAWQLTSKQVMFRLINTKYIFCDFIWEEPCYCCGAVCLSVRPSTLVTRQPMFGCLAPPVERQRSFSNAALSVVVNISHKIFIISRGAEGPGREILQRPPSVCLSVRPSVCLSVCPSRLVFAL